MLTQGPTPDLKCELNITLFLTLPYSLHCLICAKDTMIIVMFLQVMGGWEGWGWFIYVRVGGQGMGIIFFLIFCSVLCCC